MEQVPGREGGVAVRSRSRGRPSRVEVRRPGPASPIQPASAWGGIDVPEVPERVEDVHRAGRCRPRSRSRGSLDLASTYWPCSFSWAELPHSRSIIRVQTDDFSPNQIGVPSTRCPRPARGRRGQAMRHSLRRGRACPGRRRARGRSAARNWSTATLFASMIETETSIRPCVCESHGRRLEVQPTYSARRSVKSNVLDSQSSRWNAV